MGTMPQSLAPDPAFDPAPQTSPPIWKLSGMMYLIYAVQGAWWPLLAVHLHDLGISGRQRGWIFGTMAIASLVTPLWAGQVADRLLSAQRLMAIVFAIGTGFLLAIASGLVQGAALLFGVFLAYWLVSAPAYGLAGALALRNLPRPAEQFGGVRLWGTVGWMSVGWVVSAVMAASGSSRSGGGAYEAFWVATALSGAFAVYCLILPDTPPLACADRKGLDLSGAFVLAKNPAVRLYLITAFCVSLTTPFMYQVIPPYLEQLGLARTWTTTAMTLGQVPEIAALAVFPGILGRLGFKGTMALGIAAYVVRYGTLAAGAPLWMAVAGILLHGVGTGCFSIAGQMFLDEKAPYDRRAGAQALNTVVTSGLGSLLGNILAGEIVGRAGVNLSMAFLWPCLINAVMLVAFLASFRPREEPSLSVVAS